MKENGMKLFIKLVKLFFIARLLLRQEGLNHGKSENNREDKRA